MRINKHLDFNTNEFLYKNSSINEFLYKKKKSFPKMNFYDSFSDIYNQRTTTSRINYPQKI